MSETMLLVSSSQQIGRLHIPASLAVILEPYDGVLANGMWEEVI